MLNVSCSLGQMGPILPVEYYRLHVYRQDKAKQTFGLEMHLSYLLWV